MHIPDGYLSPASAGTLYALSAPFWYVASRKVKQLSGKVIPLMALMSAFCFVIQMINVPLPGGTTGHAAGASLAAIVLTPWPAVITVSVALMIQALFFGDGGITALGANCFNMAIVPVFLSYWMNRSLPASSISARSIVAAIAGFISIIVSGVLAGVELGLQPMIASTPDGTPLYAPYPLSIAVPAMFVGHIFAGIAEALVTGTAISFLYRSAPGVLPKSAIEHQTTVPLFWIRLRRFWIVIAILTILTPLGLLAPHTPWGEWSSEELRDSGLGFVPEGLQRMEGFWNAIFADYSVQGLGDSTGYFVSAVAGILLILFIFAILTFFGKKAGEKQAASGR